MVVPWSIRSQIGWVSPFSSRGKIESATFFFKPNMHQKDVSKLRTQKPARSSTSLKNHMQNYETATISSCKVVIRSRKSCRCCARDMVSFAVWRGRKYWRNSSNARQKRAADTKLPKPRCGNQRLFNRSIRKEKAPRTLEIRSDWGCISWEDKRWNFRS